MKPDFPSPFCTYKRLSLGGEPAEPLEDVQDRPSLDPARYSPLDRMAKYGCFQHGIWWKDCLSAMKATAVSIFFPGVLYISILNSAFVAAGLSGGTGIAPALLAYG